MLPKTPRWTHELASRGLDQHSALSLLERGEGWPRAATMRRADEAHTVAVAQLERCLSEEGLSVRSLAASSARPADLLEDPPDLVCTAGGDGTLLRTAALLPPGMPLLAINTDPERSTGALCSTQLCPRDTAASAARLAASLRRGAFAVRPRYFTHALSR